MAEAMRILSLGVLAVVVGCATAQPFVPSEAQRARFEEAVRQAEAAGASDSSHQAASLLADAKSDFEYAQHLPKYPERARQLADKAQREADAALLMARAARPRAAAPISAQAEQWEQAQQTER